MTADVRRLLALSGMPRRRVVLSISLGALTILFGVGLMAASGYLISRAAEQPPILSLTVSIVVVRFFGLGRPLLRYLDRLASHDLALRSLGRVRALFFSRIEPLAPGQLEGYRQGDLVNRMVGDVDALQGLYLRGIGPPAVACVVAIVATGTAAAILPLAGLILGIGLVVAGVGVPLVAARLGHRAGRARADERGHLTAELIEVLRGAPELVVYGRAQERLAQIREADRSLARHARRDALVAGLGSGLVAVTAGLTTVAALAAAVAAHADGHLDRVLVASVALLSLASFESVITLPAAAQERSATLASGRRVLALVDRRPTVHDPSSPVRATSTRPTVALESVSARYSPTSPLVVDGLSLRLEPGRRVAIVGPSGAGKTTVTNLLLRFLDPETGRVTIGGRDVREMRQEDVRRTFALAGQEAHVFNSTIRENLRLARPGATDPELEHVLARARLGDWAATLPLGLDTQVGELGSRLSGGQRQRLVLARAFLAEAPVLLLDEPTAHLDPDTADELMRDVFAATPGQSILLITHRQEGLALVDEVVELRSPHQNARPAPSPTP
jgi:thiol reductant ABC exporter CydC subunit